MSTGVFNTTNFTNNLAKKSFASMITRLMPNGQAPLFALTSYLKTFISVFVTRIIGCFSLKYLMGKTKCV